MGNNGKKLKVALVHDHLTTFGGAERVLFALHNMFPSAPIYTLFYKQNVVDAYFPSTEIKTSSLQKLPQFLLRRFYWISFLAIPAIENFNFSNYDIVISSSAFFAKGIITDHKTIHISYCHTPTRYLWEREEHKRNIFRKFTDILGTHILRLWDFNAASRVDYFIANSKYTKKRISKYYKRDAFIVYPPVDIDFIEQGDKSGAFAKKAILEKLPDKFFLIVSQLRKYKNIDVAIQAFNKLKYPLVIVGEGPLLKKLKQQAGENIIILGRQPDDIVEYCYQNCYAYIHPVNDDFGISPVEAMLFGKPVLAYRSGGALESIVEGVSGEFFNDLHPAVLADGVRRLNENYATYNDFLIKSIANRFNKERFQDEFRRVLKKILNYEWNGEEEKFSTEQEILNTSTSQQAQGKPNLAQGQKLREEIVVEK